MSRPSPSPSPSPGPPGNLKPINVNARASLAPAPRTPTSLSPRPPGIHTARPTSELLSGSNTLFNNTQTPESEAIDQWFENLQNYETTLEEMAAASLDVNFKEELSAIEQWFRVLSEAERTAALYSLLQHSTQMQIRFFITVLQQMARSDPMTALLSPAVGSSMQSQMEAKLSSMGLKSPVPPSPSSRNFNGNFNRQSLGGDSFLSPDSANIAPGNNGNSDAAATLAHQRARLKANAAHRISAPGTLISEGGNRGSNAWPSSQLGQVVERAPSPNTEPLSPGGNNTSSPVAPPSVSHLSAPQSARPKSTDFTGVANSFRSPRLAQVADEGDQLSPMVGGNWASMVNTPLVPMFGNSAADKGQQNGNHLDAAAKKLASWSLSNNTNGRVVLDDARKFRRASTKSETGLGDSSGSKDNGSVVYGDDGEPINQNGSATTNTAPQRGNANNSFGQFRNNNNQQNNGNNAGNAYLGAQGNWTGQRSPALSNVSSNRFGGAGGNEHTNQQDAISAQLAAMNFGGGANGPLSASLMPGFNMFPNGMVSPMAAAMNMNMAAAAGMMGGAGGMMPGMVEGLALNPVQQAQIFAAQLAAQGFNPAQFGLAGLGANTGGRSVRSAGGRSPGTKASSNNGRDGNGGGKGGEDDVDPALLNDVPAWLRSLRLHKYTPNFEGMGWKEMVVLDEAQLEGKGVAALGARRKLLKTFETVRAKMGIAGPEGTAGGESSAASAA